MDADGANMQKDNPGFRGAQCERCDYDKSGLIDNPRVKYELCEM